MAIFIRGVMPNLDIVEEFVQLMAMNGITTGKDIFIALQRVLTDMKLDLSKLISVTTDGATAMARLENGVVTLLERRMKDLGISHKIKKLHCIIHQETLCARSLKLKEVTDVVVTTVNLILSRELNHRQFQQFLLEMQAEFGDLTYFCNVRWLSRRKMLQRFYALLEEIATFLISKNKNVSHFHDPLWVSSLGFLVDITTHLNDLNLKLQGKTSCAMRCIGKLQLLNGDFVFGNINFSSVTMLIFLIFKKVS